MQDLIKVAVCFMYCIIISPGALCTGGGGGVTAVHEALGSLGHVDSSSMSANQDSIILKFDSFFSALHFLDFVPIFLSTLNVVLVAIVVMTVVGISLPC